MQGRIQARKPRHLVPTKANPNLIASKRKATNERVITGKPERMGADQSRDKSKANGSSTGASQGTEGKSGTKGSIPNISTEQKTRVKWVFSGHLVAPARDINVAVSVGVVVPRSVHFYPVPEAIVTIVPDYRGYEYFMIDDSHVAIVDPDTLEVVDSTSSSSPKRGCTHGQVRAAGATPGASSFACRHVVSRSERGPRLHRHAVDG
jgi:Protein of unknown function (DUF1236)